MRYKVGYFSQKDKLDFSPGVTEPWFLPEYPDRPVYAVIPRRYDPAKPIGLFFFMKNYR